MHAHIGAGQGVEFVVEAVEDAIGPPLSGASDGVITIVQFRWREDNKLVPLRPSDRKAIDSWNQRHKHAPDSAFKMPDFTSVKT